MGTKGKGGTEKEPGKGSSSGATNKYPTKQDNQAEPKDHKRIGK